MGLSHIFKEESNQSTRRNNDNNLYFRQLIPGIDYCLGSYNPFKKIFHEFGRGMQNIVYIVGNKRTKECIIIDACWDINGIIETIKMDGITPVACVATHNHFDHVGGKPPAPFTSYGIKVPGMKQLLKEYPNIFLYIHQEDADLLVNDTGIDPSRLRTTKDGQTMCIGQNGFEDNIQGITSLESGQVITLSFLHTPGHTPGSQCVLINERRLLTGDTLFPDSCGRMDLPGGCALQMYNTLQNKLSNLSENIIIYPGHCYGGKSVSTIKRERQRGLLRSITMEEWASVFVRPVENTHFHNFMKTSQSNCCMHHHSVNN